MVYTKFAEHTKGVAHWAIETTFPSSPIVATATGFVGWYGYRVGMTYSQAPLTAWFVSKVGSVAGYSLAPLFIPSLVPYISLGISIGAACLTSIALNLLAMAFFAIKAAWCNTPPKLAVPLTPAPVLAQIKVPPRIQSYIETRTKASQGSQAVSA